MSYRFVMKLAHRFNWHYAPPIYPDGDKQLWCKWCGFRQTVERRIIQPYQPTLAEYSPNLALLSQLVGIPPERRTLANKEQP